MSTTLTSINPIDPSSMPHQAPFAAKRVLALLSRIQHGRLTLTLPDGSVMHFGHDRIEPGNDNNILSAGLSIHDWRVFSKTLKSGDIGFAEGYIDGWWSTPHLADLLRLFVRNRETLQAAIFGHWGAQLINRVRHWLNRNTKSGSRKNIHAHYDLGNPFYSLWLDETMNYSAALFNGQLDQPLSRAQDAKVRRALYMAQVRSGERVLEIGCGWGALAEMAACEFGARVTGVTLSTEQLQFARARLAWREATLKADLRLQDYRDIQDEPFDAICSIEMFEAVGREYWDDYFGAISRLLKSGGRACIQSIVIDDALFERYIRSTDFIQQYIFPGGCLPSPSQFKTHAEKAGLRVVDEMAFGADYAETLRRWRNDFLTQHDQVLAQGFDSRFIRTWEFYLAYCEAGFDEGNTDVIQFTLQKD